MKTTNIKGKEYVEVAERVKYFRSEDEYKGWNIETELLSNENGVCVFKATVKDPEGSIKAIGHAYEKEDSTYINKTSYIENCETSAVGRALGFLGIGIDASIASADEVVNAINNQGEAPKKNGLDFDKLREQCKGLSLEELNRKYIEVKTFKGYTDKQKEAICKIIDQEKASR